MVTAVPLRPPVVAQDAAVAPFEADLIRWVDSLNNQVNVAGLARQGCLCLMLGLGCVPRLAAAQAALIQLLAVGNTPTADTARC